MNLSLKLSAAIWRRAAFGLFCLCSLLFSQAAYSQAAYSQDFSSIDQDLAQLEDLINDTIANTEEQQKLLEGLRENLSESGNLIESYERIMSERENSLRELQARLNEMSETYRKQSQLSARYAQSSKFWKTFTLIGIPVTALISGGIVYAVTR
jgi:septal ring factor EnvC (AmiA/AmiB activator)